MRPVAALKTRVWIAQGRLSEALDWASEQGLSADDNLSYLREFEHITLARILLARYKSERKDSPIHKAIGLLERLQKAAEAGGRMGSDIEILVLQALAHQARATSLLHSCLWNGAWGWRSRRATSEYCGRRDRWLDCWPCRRPQDLPDYTGKLLAAFEAEEQKSADQSHPVSCPT